MNDVCRAVTLTAFLRLSDVAIRQPGADAQPCDPEFILAVLKIFALSAIAAERWLAVHIAAPRPLIDMSRKTGIPPDPANRQAAPHHRVVVTVALPVNPGDVEDNGLVVEHRSASRNRDSDVAWCVTETATLSIETRRNRGSERDRLR
jgi:hypothetical protein